MASDTVVDPAPAGLEAYYEMAEYADMELVICLESSGAKASGASGGSTAAGDGAKQSARVLHTVAAHRVVLAAQSAWAKAMLNKVQPAQGAQPRLELSVTDKAEGAAAQLLVRTLYSTGNPRAPLEGQPQLALLRVLQLADRLQAPRAAAAAAQLLGAAPVLERDTVLALWQLPDGCRRELLAYKPVLEAAAKALQARLGDLDAAELEDSSARDGWPALPCLPLDMLVALLRSNETRASSENVVFQLCSDWIWNNDGSTEEEQRALASCLRLHHMSPLYLTTIVAHNSWVPRKALALAAGYVSATDEVKRELMRQCGAELQAPARPPSRIKEGTIEWALPLANLRALHEEAAALDVGRAFVDDYQECFSESSGWGGLRWHLEVRGTHIEAGVEFALIVKTEPVLYTVDSHATWIAAADIALSCGDRRISRSFVFVGTKDGDGDNDGEQSIDLFGLGTQAAWDEGAWRNAGLVGDGDIVKITATIGRLA